MLIYWTVQHLIIVGYQLKHKGLRYCLAYFTYAEYIIQSQFEDTFTGMVGKNRTETEHATGGQLKHSTNFN